jgi:peptidyl-dipeptidase A
MGTAATAADDSAVLTEARQFIADHEARVKPLEKSANLAWWEASTTGKDEAFKLKEEAQNKLDESLVDTARFATLKRIRAAVKTASGTNDVLIQRQLDLLYLQYLEKQVDPELLKKITAKANLIEKSFNNYRAKVDGKELADSEIRNILKTSHDSKYRQAVWEANKGVGSVIETDLKELVKLRNEAARKLSFKNYHDMSLQLNEQSQEQVMKLFDQLDALIRKPFQEVKAGIDKKLAKDCGVAVAELRPWHYQDPFFQESPAEEGPGFDDIYAKADIQKLCREFYAGIGLPIDTVLAHSDLFEKPGKNPHAFCSDLDRQGDVRVLANIVSNEYWMGTMLHELGHATYSSLNIPQSVPYVLRMESHPLTTEGIAMMLEKFSQSATWLEKMGIPVKEREKLDAAGQRAIRNHLLIFAAWNQAMFRFEVGLYDNPDQDLNKLWWDLVERYQGIHRPEGRNAPDYAAKLHISQAPAYYHNYLMGQLFASQVHHTIARDILKTELSKALYNGHKEVGEYLKQKVYVPGRSLHWNELTRFATGEELNAKAFAEDLSAVK